MKTVTGKRVGIVAEPQGDLSQSSVALDLLAMRLSQLGLPGAFLQRQGDLLILCLPQEARDRLLADSELRRQVVFHARACGFSRAALELESQRGRKEY